MAATNTPDTVIFVTPKALSDGSKVFDVRLGNEVWPAVTEDDANSLAEKIKDAIEDHTNATAGVVYES
jgi:hypothetical protein